MQQKVAILQRTSIFSAAPHSALERLAAALDELFVAAGERIFSQGDDGDSLYIVVEGHVRVHEGELLLNDLGAGDVFGEMALLDPQPRSASVTALQDTRLLRLDEQALNELMNEQPEVGQAIIKVLCRRLRARVRDHSQDYVYMQQFAQVTGAAQALEAGAYAPEMLAVVARRTDALGDLARVFQHMAGEVAAREQHLRQQVRSLQIEIDRAQQAHHVRTIVETSYFKGLQQQAQHLRAELDNDG